MYANPLIRIVIIAVCSWLAAHSPPAWGYPFAVDGWLWQGVRDIAFTHVRDLPLYIGGAMIVADLLGYFCPSTAIPVRRPARWALVITVVAAVVLWLLRVHRWFGDLVNIDKDEIPYWTFETAEPLGAYTFYYITHAAAALGMKYSTGMQITSTAFGATAVAAIFLWARLVSPEWPLVFLMIASSGSLVLLYGYPEKGTPKAIALMCWYVYFTAREFRERRAATQVSSSLFLSLAMLMHGSQLCWLPAHAWYVWRPAGWRKAAQGILAFFVPILIMTGYFFGLFGKAWVVGGSLGNTTAQMFWFKKYCVTNCGYDFWSAKHGLDVLNCLLVLGPVALLCFPEALFHSRNHEERWLALGSLGCLFLSATWFPVFGYTSDWDIFALAPLVLNYFGALVGADILEPRRFRRLALAWIVGTLLHGASWWRFFQIQQ